MISTTERESPTVQTYIFLAYAQKLTFASTKSSLHFLNQSRISLTFSSASASVLFLCSSRSGAVLGISDIRKRWKITFLLRDVT